MSTLRQAAQQALEALVEINKLSIGERAICLPGEIDTAMDALRAALAEPDSDYERGFVDGMNLQTKGSVDKAVNHMTQNPFGDDAERYARKLHEEREVRNLADYEFKTYKTGGAELEAGFYSTDELRDLVKALDKMNATTERSMRKMK